MELVAISNFTLEVRTDELPIHYVISTKLTVAEQNAIKKITDLATSINNTFLSIAYDAIPDTSTYENELLAIYPNDSLQAELFVPDKTDPELVDYSLDLDEGILELTFDETVRSDSLNITQITFQNESDSSAAQYTLTEAEWSNEDSTVVVIKLSAYDLNKIKQLRELCYDENSTFLLITSKGIMDMNMRSVVAIREDKALMVDNFTEDTTRPQLLYFDLNLNTEQLLLTFTETVDTLTLNYFAFTLFGEEDYVNYTLSSGSTPSNDWFTIVIQLDIDDLNNIKRDEYLAVDNSTIRLLLEPIAIFDMNDNELDMDEILNVTIFTEDTRPPVLLSFDLDMDADQLVLTFNETMDVDTLMIVEIVFQNSQNISLYDGNHTQYYMFEYSSVITPNDPVVNISIHPNDANIIKSYSKLATDKINTYLSFSSDLVSDMNKNKVVEINSYNSMNVAKFTADTTSPVLVSYEFDLTIEELRLVFNETVNVNSFDVREITVESETSEFTLSGGIIEYSMNNTNITIEFKREDLNEIKKDEELATSSTNTFLTFTSALLRDMNDNYIIPVNMTESSTYIPDRVSPELESYHLDMNNGIIHLSFSETVRVQSLLPQSFTFQNDEAFENATEVYTVMYGESLSLNGPVVEMTLSKLDQDNIKRLSSLATSTSDTYLTVSNTGIRDMNNNSLVAVNQTSALQAANFTPDRRMPELFTYDLDMDHGTGILWLTFSETMLVSSLNADQITLHSSRAESSVNYTLTNESTLVNGSFDDPIVGVNFSLYDSNEIKKLFELATDHWNTYLTMTSYTITDMNFNMLVEIEKPKLVSDYTEDITDPELRSFTVDLNSNVLSLTFTETVNTDTLDVTEITLQDSQDTNDDMVKLTFSSISYSLNSSVIEVNLGTYDRNILTALTNLFNERNDSYLSLTSDAISDMNNNSVVPLNTSNALLASSYIEDSTNPSLLNFTVDLDNGTISLFFNETVSLETIDYTKFHLYSDEDGNISVNLTNGSFSAYYTHMPVVFMVRVDIDRTKVTEYLWTNFSDTWLYIEEGAIFDWTMMNPVETDVLQSDQKPIENNGPVLQTFAINITSGVITLNYNEPVRPKTLVYQRFMLHNAAVNYTVNYRLTGGTSPSGNGRLVLINMKAFDLNYVKSLTGLYTNENTTFLTLSPGAIRDMVLNPSVGIYDKQVDVFIEDTNRPYLVNYELDMDEGIMMLNFSETVDVSTFVLSRFVLQRDSNVSYDQEMNYHRFTSKSTAMTSDLIELLDNKTVIILMHLDDLNEIKRKMIATNENTTWLVIEEDALVDNNNRPVVELINGITAKQPVVYINDTTPPKLQRFDISLDAGTLVLSFSETVDATSLNILEITIQNQADNPSEHYTLTNKTGFYNRSRLDFTSCLGLSVGSALGSGDTGSGIFSGSDTLVEMDLVLDDDSEANSSTNVKPLSSFNYHELKIYLSHEDLNNIKALTGLASNRYTSYISITVNAISDMVGNNVAEVPSDNATLAKGYKHDMTRPEVMGFDLDIDSGSLTMTFTETVNVSSLDVTQLTLQSERDHFNSILSLYSLKAWPPYPNTSHSFSNDGPVILIQIGHQDLNAMKKIRTLAIDNTTTYLSWTSLAIYDNAGNSIITCLSVFAHQVFDFTPDDTRPELVSFDLDLNDGRLILTFSETVKVIDSLDVTQITIQSMGKAVSSNLTQYTLKDLIPFESSSMDEDGPVVAIRLGFIDLNALKYRTELATSRNDTFISITNLTVVDMQDFEVEEIFDYDGLRVRIHTPDSSDPVLVNFTLDMDTTTLTLTFNETVNADSLNVSHISLQNDNSSSDDYHSSPYSLTPGANETYTSSDNGHIIIIHLGPKDRNEIKRRQNLTVNMETTWLTMNSSAILDMNGNAVTAVVDGKAHPTGGFTPDSTPPVLIDFSIDMDEGQFVMTFDETVKADTLVIDRLTLQDNGSYINATYQLTNKGNSSQSDSTIITVDLHEDDLNEIKRLTICTEIADCYILHQYLAVKDMNKNPIESRADGYGLVTFDHLPDITPPVLLEFVTNLTSETLTLTFTETVDASSIDFTAITLQDFFVAGTNYTLTSGKVQEDDSTIITFNFTWSDLNEVKRDTDLFISRPSSWLTVTRNAIQDMALLPNHVVPVLNALNFPKSLPTKRFTEDVTRPELWDFDLNLKAMS